MMIWMLGLTIACFALQTLSLRQIETDDPRRQLLSTGTFSGCIAAALVVYFLFQKGCFSPTTLLFGILFGVGFVITVTVYYYAMHSGPLSYTTFFYSSSMVIPVIAGLLLWNESLEMQTLIGILLFIAAFYCISVWDGSKTGGINRRWMVLSFASWFFNGLLSVILKQHQLLRGGEEYLEMLTVSFLTACAVCFAAAGILYARAAERPTRDAAFLRRSACPLLGAALGSGVGNILITYLSSRLSGVYLFPLVLGSVVVAVTLYSTIFLKEKLGRPGLIGIAVGLAAITVINL